MVMFIPKAITDFVRFFSIGLFATVYFIVDLIINIIFNFVKYVWFGFVYICILVYKLVSYEVKGIKAIFYIIFYPFIKLGEYFDKLYEKSRLKSEEKYALKLKEKKLKEEELIRQETIKKQQKEEKLRLKQAAIEEKKLSKQTKEEHYVNENVVIEKKKFSDYISGFKAKISSKFSNFKDKIVNNRFKKAADNKREISRQALLLDFTGDDAIKSEEKVMYKYVAKNPDGKIVKGYFPAYSKVEVHSFLLSEGNEVYSIETNKSIQRMYGKSTTGGVKVKTSDLIFFCTQLSTYIKAGITLVEALRILSKQFKNKGYNRIIRSMIYDLSMGDSFSTAMEKQGESFPRLLINMLKASEMTGELPEVLDDMAEYFEETDKTRKQMITAMTYPSIILGFSIIAVAFIMIWVVPRFVGIYEDIDGSKIPGITIFVMNLSAFLKSNYLYIILGIALFVIVFMFLYKYIKSFKAIIQWIVMHMPVFGNVVIYNEVTMFTKTFASLLAHNVYITDSMEILNKITNNEIYKMLILDTITNLAKGEKISLAFKDHWAFPIPAYEMITTGEMTGQLPEMMAKVSSYYQELHRNSVTRIKTFIEPVLILFLTVVVGGVVLSIVIPMFSVYSAIQM